MMAIAETTLLERRTVGAKPVGNNPLRLDVLILQLPPQQSKCSASIAPLLHAHIHDLAFVIDSAPDPHMLTANRRYDLIEMPAQRWRQLSTAKVGGDLWAELHRPRTDRFVAHIDTAMRHHLLDIAQAKRETEIEPNRVLNDG